MPAVHSLNVITALNQASQRVQQTLVPADVFEAIVEEISSLGYQIFLCTYESGDWNLAQHSFDESRVREVLSALELLDNGSDLSEDLRGFCDILARSGKGLFVDSFSDLPGDSLPEPVRAKLGQALSLLGIRKAIAAPMVLDGDAIGLLFILGSGVHPDDVLALEGFANHVAIAVDHARLYHRTQQELRKRKCVERALRESEQRYRRLYDGLTDALFVHSFTDEGGASHFIEVNDVACQRLGYSRDELLRMAPSDIDAPESEACVSDIVSRLVAGDDVTFEQIHITKDGERIPVEIHSKAIKLDGAPAVLSMVRDMTDHRRTQRALQESEAKFRSLVESSSHHMFILDRDGYCLFSNHEVRYLGMTDNDSLVGQHLREVFAPDVAQRYERQLRRVIETHRAVSFEHTLELSGDVRTHMDTLYPILREDALWAVGGVSRDISESKRMEARLRHSDEKHRALYNNAPLPYQSLDREGTLIDVNPAWLRTLGYDRDAVIGRSFATFLHPACVSKFRQCLPAFLRRGSVHEVEFRLRHQKGHYLWASFEGRVGYGPDGSIRQTYCVFQDITQRKYAEEQAAREKERAELLLRIADRLSGSLALDDLSAVICHEIEDALDVNAVSILLYHPEREHFSLEASIGLPTPCPPIYRLPDSEIHDRILKEGMFVTPDLRKQNERIDPRLYDDCGVRTVVEIGMIYKEALQGVLHVYGLGEPRDFEMGALSVLRGIADQAAQAIVTARLFDQLRISQQRLEDLSRKLVRAQEIERRYLVRELHDGIGQLLTMVKLDLQSIRGGDLSERAEAIQRSLGTVEVAIHQVRSLSRDLRPSVLDDLGLVPALRWFVDREGQQAPFDVSFAADPLSERLAPAIENAYFRIVQEAMTNAVRHAEAQHFSVELRRDGESLVLNIRDDGIGFDVDRAFACVNEGGSFGLLSMRERAILIGGDFDVRSEPAEGTHIRVRTSLSSLPSCKETTL